MVNKEKLALCNPTVVKNSKCSTGNPSPSVLQGKVKFGFTTFLLDVTVDIKKMELFWLNLDPFEWLYYLSPLSF
jgi:hypothetical protein